MWLTIFKTGTHTDSQGRTKTWTEEDLERIVESYDPEQREAPLVLGHPRDDAPAYGWVEALRRAGQELQARFKQVPEELRKAVEAGRYKYKSIALYPDKSLRHVALLGAEQPAVPGLGSASFQGGESYETIEFQEADMTLEEVKKELEKERRARQDLESRFSQTQQEYERIKQEKERAEAERLRQTREERFNRLVQDGKAVPADKDKVLAFAAQLAQGEEITFSQQEGKKPLEEHFWAWMESADKHSLFGEYSAPAGKEEEETTQDLTKQV